MEQIVPVKEGDIRTLETLPELGSKGDGVAKIDGFTIIIVGAGANEKLKVKITKVLHRFAFAEKLT